MIGWAKASSRALASRRFDRLVRQARASGKGSALDRPPAAQRCHERRMALAGVSGEGGAALFTKSVQQETCLMREGRPLRLAAPERAAELLRGTLRDGAGVQGRSSPSGPVEAGVLKQVLVAKGFPGDAGGAAGPAWFLLLGAGVAVCPQGPL